MVLGKCLFVYPNKCTGCRICELICSSSHNGGENNPKKSSVRVVTLIEDGIDFPVVCQHCKKAPCMDVCPTQAIYQDSVTKAVLINKDACIGCSMCLMACPLGAISIDPSTGFAFKCDLCGGNPKCVRRCPKGAIQFDTGGKVSMLKKREHIETLKSVREMKM
jgi:Fe-S-cluster-containing hydrogenase component 2